MAFQPRHERHAIHEVVFVLTFARNFSSDDIERVESAHDQWKTELPAVLRPVAIQLPAGENSPPALGPGAAISFDAMKRDGSLDWRLRLQENWIAVNCLTYTHWADVWGQAKSLLNRAVKIAFGDDNSVTSFALQYIDFFDWVGDAKDYQIAELFNKDCEFIPSSIWGKGPLWHLHQGWFCKDGLPVEGRMLERVHLDATEQSGLNSVKMDTTLRIDLKNNIGSHAELFVGSPALVDNIFSYVHDVHKQIMLKYLTDEMAKRIDLNG